MAKEQFDQELKKLDDLYEEGKDCLLQLVPLEENGEENESCKRLYKALGKLRAIAAVAMKKSADTLLDEHGWYTDAGAYQAVISRLKKNDQGEYELVRSDKKWLVVIPPPISKILGEEKRDQLHDLIDLLLQHEVTLAISARPTNQ